MPEATKVGDELRWGAPTKESLDHLSKWLCKITWQVKNIKQYLLSSNILGLKAYCKKLPAF